MAYADTTELARVLKIREPTDEQEAALDRVLEAASLRIDSELDRPADDPIGGAETLLAEAVCLAYAAELYKFEEVQFGLVGIGAEAGPAYAPSDLWEKHAKTLEPLKGQWGIA